MKNKLLLFAVTFFIALIAQSQTLTNNDYLKPVFTDLQKQWPNNRTINFVFHGQSAPSGYFNTPYLNTLKGYPHLTLCYLKEYLSYAVVNVIITDIGGEQSEQVAIRCKDEVLTMRPDVLSIAYVLNDKSIGLEKVQVARVKMIEEGLLNHKKIILLTPSPDMTEDIL